MYVFRRIPYWGFWALLIYMPFHVFLSQSLSLATGGLEVWKIGKDAVLAALVLFTICLVFWRGRANKLFKGLLIISILYALLHLVLWRLNTDVYYESAVLGFVYNMRLPAFLLLGMGAALLNPGKFVFSSVMKIVLAVSTVVAALGVLQYFLPKDILTHLGYSLERGVRPAFFIDDHPDLPRIMSTLREPNALGAYLILPVAALVALLTRLRNLPRIPHLGPNRFSPRGAEGAVYRNTVSEHPSGKTSLGQKARKDQALLGLGGLVRDSWLRLVLAGSLALHLLAILLTFSRSAWLATALVVLLVLWWSYKKYVFVFVKRFWPLMVGLLLVAAVGAFSLRNTDLFQGYVVHSTDLATSEESSTDLHYLLAREGAEEIIERPQGYGPGSAGLASIRDPAGGQLTENYYLQIAYEVGILGLIIFIALNVYVYRLLMRRNDTFGLVLLAAFWGYVVTNMLLHSWSNETIAAQFWLLAGVALVFHKNPKKQIN